MSYREKSSWDKEHFLTWHTGMSKKGLRKVIDDGKRELEYLDKERDADIAIAVNKALKGQFGEMKDLLVEVIQALHAKPSIDVKVKGGEE